MTRSTFIQWTEVVQDKSFCPVDNFIHCFEQLGPDVPFLEINKCYTKKLRRKNMHSIRTDFGFNLLHSASKLKRGVIEKIGGVFHVIHCIDIRLRKKQQRTNTEDHIEKKGS
jgi:hypothetical protein